jgi:hypothetical protein
LRRFMPRAATLAASVAMAASAAAAAWPLRAQHPGAGTA